MPSAQSSPSSSRSSSPPSNLTSQSSASAMVRAQEESDSTGSRSPRTTTNRVAIDIPRTQAASKGGCWTCRLRRKKCDEQRVSDSCQTCTRLKIKCLGWGSKRPEWMRDKQAVEIYKADIKAQLTRAGLIRGQPRSSLSGSVPTPKTVPSQTYNNTTKSTPIIGPGNRFSPGHVDQSSVDYSFAFLDSHNQLFPPPHSRPNSSSSVSSSSNGFHRVPLTTSPNIHSADLTNITPTFHFSPSPSATSPLISTIPLSSSIFPDSDPLNFEPFTSGIPTFEFNPPPPEIPAPLSMSSSTSQLAGQDSIQGEHVLYYFEHVRRMQYIFAGNSVTNVTYSLIVQEPRGAVTNAVCAMASLHYTRTRVAQGLEAPELNPEHSTAKYFFDEAYFQLVNSKQMHGHYTESDAIAALHLVSYSLFSGGTADWRSSLRIALEWLGQTTLLTDTNPKMTLMGMSHTGKCAAKITLWMEIFASLSLMQPPKYMSLYRRLFASGGGFWTDQGSDDTCDLRMESISGCTDEAMLGIAEVVALADWKAQETRKGSLSVRELIRRGDAIEQKIRQHLEPISFAEMDQAPLHPSLPSIGVTQVPMASASAGVPAAGPFPNEEMRRVVANLFRESVLLFLHTVLSDSHPGVPEICSSVDTILQLLNQLPPSEVDRSLVFPICLAGCMSDDSAQRDQLKGRLQAQDESIGNLLQSRALMEAVWQMRDTRGGAVDWRDTMRERGLNLLLI